MHANEMFLLLLMSFPKGKNIHMENKQKNSSFSQMLKSIELKEEKSLSTFTFIYS